MNQFKNNISHNKNNKNLGPSAILSSRLVSQGWKFPNILIVEADEKYLFDVEVKLKLGHDGSYGLLVDVLNNFPVEIIIQRTGLLETIFDCVGSLLYKNENCNILIFFIYNYIIYFYFVCYK